MVAGTVVVYAFGTVGFAIAGDVGLVEAFLLAGAPFVPVELVKMAAAVGVVRSEAVAAS